MLGFLTQQNLLCNCRLSRADLQTKTLREAERKDILNAIEVLKTPRQNIQLSL